MMLLMLWPNLGCRPVTLDVDGMVYAGSFDNHLYAINSTSGDVAWKFNVVGTFFLSSFPFFFSFVWVSVLLRSAPSNPVFQLVRGFARGGGLT